MADDLGFSDLGCYGGEIETPHLDRLAANGLRFTQFYNCGRCCPTRAALLTGLSPHQAGVGDMEEPLGPPAYQGYLNERCVTIAEVLGAHGYRTMISGKWNVGYVRPRWPIDRGFEHAFGLLQGACDYFNPEGGTRGKIGRIALDGERFADFGTDFYITDAFTDYALKQLRQVPEGRPFFLYLPYTAPHSPLHARKADIARVRGRYREGWDTLRRRRRARLVEKQLIDASSTIAADDPRVPSWASVADPDFEDLKMSVYAAQVECMDRNIGRVLGWLSERGIERQTLVMFLSDNGGDGAPESFTPELPPGAPNSSYIYGRPWARLSNTPLRGYKRETYEGGIASPLIACWPDVIQPGGISHQPAHVIDLMSTCLEAAGAAYPESFHGRPVQPTEGQSLLPEFRGEVNIQAAGDRTLYWEHEGHRAVREGRWKLVAPPGSAWELYDLAADRGETFNLAERHSEIVSRLSDKYAAWAGRCGVVDWRQLSERRE